MTARVVLPSAKPARNDTTTSAWVEVGDGMITAAGAPSRAALALWSARWRATDVLTLQRGDEARASLADEAAAAGLAWHHAPLSGKRLDGVDDRAALASASARAAALLARGRRVVVHCSAGMHRTGLVVYGALRLAGRGRDDALAGLALARPITHAELTRVDHRDGGTLADVAERVLAPLLASSASHAPPDGSEAVPAPGIEASEGDVVLVF